MSTKDVKVFPRALPISQRPLISANDFTFLLKLPFLIGASLLPEAFWSPVCRGAQRLKSTASLASRGSTEEKISRALKLPNASDRALEVVVGAKASRLENSIQVLREVTLGWRPELRLEGTAYLDAALASGNGVVLWVAHFAFGSLAIKKAMSERGYRVNHISRPEHGFSKSRFGIKWLNPIRCRAEDRYLQRRVLIERTVPSSAYRTALDILRSGNIVSTTAGAWEGLVVAEGPFLNARLVLAVGAPKLALEAGALLLPVFAVRVPEKCVIVNHRRTDRSCQ